MLFYDAYSSNVELVEEDAVHTWLAVSDPELTGIEAVDTCAEYPAFNLLKLYSIINCGVDFAGDFLKFALPNIPNSNVTSIEDGDEDWESQGVIRKFSQKEFVDKKVWQFSGLDEFGYVFFPNSCLADGASCKVHVVLHGCGQHYQNAFLGLVKYSGFNEYAVTNQMIILYPQANAHALFNG